MTGTELLKRYVAGERDFHDADLRGATLHDADLYGANLRGADLRRADLRRATLYGADLRDADLDYASFPLWCGTFGIICDQRLVSQLLYHLCRLDVRDCPEWDELRHDPRLVALANQSHVIATHELPEVGV